MLRIVFSRLIPAFFQLTTGNLDSVPETIRVQRKDFYNLYRRNLLDASRKDADGFESLRMWAEQLTEEGWNTLLLKPAPGCGLSDCLVFGMISPWQRTVSQSSFGDPFTHF